MPGSGLDRDHRITVPVTDLLGTTQAVVDLVSGELVESSSYYPNGARETLRQAESGTPGAEPRGFTGKESDDEVGLVYFGERYLIPRLGRWASPDPLHIHEAGGGEALNAYHYVSGNVLQARDPIGLDADDFEAGAAEGLFGGLLGAYVGATGTAPLRAMGDAIAAARAGRLGDAVLHAVSAPFMPAVRVLDGAVESVRGAVQMADDLASGDEHRRDRALGRLVGGAALGVASRRLMPAGGRSQGLRGAARVGLVERARGRGRAVSRSARDAIRRAVERRRARRTDAAAAAEPPPQQTPLCRGGACTGSTCFAAGTLVVAREGLRPIEEVAEGEQILARNDETGQLGWRLVSHRYVTSDREVLSVQLVSSDGTDETLVVTPNHPFWVLERGWVEARDLLPGDELFSSRGGWLRVKGATWLARGQTTYNLEVGEHHTYFVGRAAAWVHNQSVGAPCPGRRPGAPTYDELASTVDGADSHHVIQNAAVRDLPGYSRDAAPAVLLEGPSTARGTPHYRATRIQEQRGGGTYAAERRIGYRALRRAGVGLEEARAAIARADEYFRSIGVTPATKTRVPGNRR